MRDQFDVDLEDTDLLGEVELSVSLMIAATASVGHLSREEIDELLGVRPRAEQDDPQADRSAPWALERRAG